MCKVNSIKTIDVVVIIAGLWLMHGGIDTVINNIVHITLNKLRNHLREFIGGPTVSQRRGCKVGNSNWLPLLFAHLLGIVAVGELMGISRP